MRVTYRVQPHAFDNPITWHGAILLPCKIVFKRGKMDKNQFVKLDLRLVQEIGLDAAFLYAVLKNASQVWTKDDDGYFTIWTKYLAKQTGWSKNKVIWTRDKLIELKLLKFSQGKNQNSKNKYKLL